MPRLSLVQLLVYGSLALAVLVVGSRWLRESGDPDQGGGKPAWSFAADAEAGKPASYGDVVVHVAGEVRKPGVYRLPNGSRVVDAVARAGGALASASRNSVNLAARLTDGQQVVIPSAMRSGGGSGAATGALSLGTATAAELDGIEGIGPVTAKRILDFRRQNGGIASVEQLDRIEGIGPATMRALRSALQP